MESFDITQKNENEKNELAKNENEKNEPKTNENENNEPKTKTKYDDVKKWLEDRVHTTINEGTNDFETMMDMLRKHPNFSKWKNQDCVAFKITRAKKTKHLQVYIKQLCNSKTPKSFDKKRWRIISWVACVKGNVVKKPTEANKLTQAMRYAIRKQIQIWRNTHPYGRKCVVCECENYEKLEVDHFPKTFSQIKRDFIKDILKDKTDNIEIYWSAPKTTYQFKKGEKTNMKWQRYHRTHASYRWLCGTCNKKANKKK